MASAGVSFLRNVCKLQKALTDADSKNLENFGNLNLKLDDFESKLLSAINWTEH